MAVVYLARELSSGQIVAIKLLGGAQGTGSDAARRFAREAETVSALEHPNIVRVLRVEELDGAAPAIVSVYIPGETLRDLLRRGPLPYERAAQILREMASALAHAHERRIVHRDVKPENIVLELHTGRALLADFGVARQLDAETILTAVGTSVGTPTYMAPEQIIGADVDARADVYALGLIGWEMLSGRRPWEGETLYGVLHKQQHEQLQPLDQLRPDIPSYLLRAIDGAIEKDPARRWHDAGEFLAKLNPAPAALPPLPNAAEVAPAPDVGPIFVPETVVPVVSPNAPAGRAPEREPEREPERAPIAPRVVAAPAPPPLVTPPLVTPPLVTPPLVTPPPPPAPVIPPPSAPHQAFPSAERRQPRGRRRWWPAAAALAALLLVAAVVLGTRRPGRPVSGDRGLDSLLTAANPAEGVVLVDSGQRARTRVEAAGTVDLARAAGNRCRSAASADQRACLLAAIRRNDVPLNAAYQALLTDLRNRLTGDAERQALAALRDEQRAWLDERDRRCRAAAPESANQLWGVARAPCFAQRSVQRTAELRARIGK